MYFYFLKNHILKNRRAINSDRTSTHLLIHKFSQILSVLVWRSGTPQNKWPCGRAFNSHKRRIIGLATLWGECEWGILKTMAWSTIDPSICEHGECEASLDTKKKYYQGQKKKFFTQKAKSPILGLRGFWKKYDLYKKSIHIALKILEKIFKIYYYDLW